jgi:hypothetical protein
VPTTNPRVSITLPPEDLAVLDRFAAATNTPRATVLSGLVSTVLPDLLKAAQLIELANEAPAQLQRQIRQNLMAASRDVMGSVEGFHDAYEQTMGKLQKAKPKKPAPSLTKKAAGRKEGARAPGPAASLGSDPHLLTGGSK